MRRVLGLMLLGGAGFGVWWYYNKNRPGQVQESQSEGGFNLGDLLVSEEQRDINFGPGEGLGSLPNTRGFRNKNPGNIEYSVANQWKGQVGTDGRFAIFGDMKYGIRAIGKIINTYRSKYGLYSISQIIGRWAPSSENNTVAYINSVADFTGYSPYIAFQGSDAELVAAIIHHENGSQPFSLDYIAGALAL